MLKKAEKPLPEDLVSPEEEIKDPVILEFLGLKDEYSECELEEALIKHLENFLLELELKLKHFVPVNSPFLSLTTYTCFSIFEI